MAFAQLTDRESLRTSKPASGPEQQTLSHGHPQQGFPQHLGGSERDADWRIYADFAHHLIGIARKLYQKEPLAVELQNTVYALDATTIDLCLSIFPRRFRTAKGAVRLHTLLDLRGNIPSFIHISDGKTPRGQPS